MEWFLAAAGRRSRTKIGKMAGSYFIQGTKWGCQGVLEFNDCRRILRNNEPASPAGVEITYVFLILSSNETPLFIEFQNTNPEAFILQTGC